ncbi:MAG: LysR family transcriptional regulator [Janthinobacterium lividum]
MQIEWLEDFIALANTRSFSRAAEIRFVTHPAFGRRIRALEAWAGTALVDRKQPIRLTEAGKLLLEAAQHSVTLLYSARAQVRNAHTSPDEPLRIATGRTLAMRFLPDWHAALAGRVGNYPMSISTGGALEGIAKLHAGDADLLLSYSSALTRMLIDPLRCETIVIEREELIPVSAPDRNARARFRADSSSMEAVPWLAFAPSLSLRGVLAHHLDSLPQRPQLAMVCEADSYETLLAMATRGSGLAWLPSMVVRDDLQTGALCIAGDQSMRVGFDISLHRLRNVANPRADAIWQDHERRATAN